MKILIIYAGLGGESDLWDDINNQIIHIEIDSKIAAVLQKRKPNRRVIVADAHQYLLEHYKEYDFIWGSPPCPTHSKMMKATRHDVATYPDMRLYQEIIFLDNFFDGKWVIENVTPYYKPLITPTARIGRHLFWSNFYIKSFDLDNIPGFINKSNSDSVKELQDWLGIHYEGNLYIGNNHCPAQVLRNCVHPKLGKYILDQSQKETAQLNLFE